MRRVGVLLERPEHASQAAYLYSATLDEEMKCTVNPLGRLLLMVVPGRTYRVRCDTYSKRFVAPERSANLDDLPDVAGVRS